MSWKKEKQKELIKLEIEEEKRAEPTALIKIKNIKICKHF